jgi:putative zinc finger/helix-turn-helix YgiT family protein
MTRPYPWKCRSCGKQSLKPVVVDYTTEMEHDGRLYSLMVPNLEILECEACRSRVLPEAALAAVVDKLRAEAGLMTPAEIREKRRRLGLTQEQLANYLRVAKETVSRWETGGQIQQRVMNDFLRAFFEVPELRAYLAELRGYEADSQSLYSKKVAMPAANTTVEMSIALPNRTSPYRLELAEAVGAA